MKIVADRNMPNVEKLFGGFGDVVYADGRNLQVEDVCDADALLVRSVTKVNEALLAGSRVKFVGSATIGVDHVDQAYLNDRGIGFSSAPGCNADAVGDYVISALSYLYMNMGVRWLETKIGILGVGNVGGTLYRRLTSAGCQVCAYDPYKEAVGADFNFVELEELLACDVICLHAPLTKEGEHATTKLLNDRLLRGIRPGTSLISAGRGGVVDELALLDRSDQLEGEIHLVMDVWDGEPNISMNTFRQADLVSPHIAGYSRQGREMGSWMVYQSFCEFFGLPMNISRQDVISAGALRDIHVSDEGDRHEVVARACAAVYDVARDDGRMRRAYLSSDKNVPFDWLRKNYVERDELNTCRIEAGQYTGLLQALGFS